MRFLAKFHASRTPLLAAALAASLYAPRALGQDTAGGTPEPSAPAPGPSATAPASSAPTPGPGATAPTPGAPLPSPAEAPAGTTGVAAAPGNGAASAGAAPASASTGNSGGPPPTPVVTQVLRSFEEMPATAYPSPSPRVRGIYGGSLWFDADMQGLQWPYYPKTGIGFSGYGWVDTGLRVFNAGEATATSAGLGAQAEKGKQFVQQSRFVLRVTPTWTDPKNLFFVQLQTEFVGAESNSSQDPIVWSVDDAWIRFGKWKLFDILLGRFQAWEVYHYGMGLDLYTLERNGANDLAVGGGPASIYGVTNMYLRQDTVGQGAVHLYPFDWLRFEVGFQYGFGTSGANTYGVRPVGIAEFGPLRIKAGAEFLETRAQTTSPADPTATQSQGFGGALQLVFDPYIEFGVNGAYALSDVRNSMGLISVAQTNETYSVGGFANVRLYGDLLFGAGLNYSHLVDEDYDPAVHRDDNYDQWQPFAALQYILFRQYGSPSPGLFIKFVAAYARADQNPTPMQSPEYRNEMYSGRLRLQYNF
jgi:hypothetical protein